MKHNRVEWQNKHVGQKLICIDIKSICSPALWAIVDKDVDAKKLVKTLERRLQEVVREVLGENIDWTMRPIEAEIVKEEIIEPQEIRNQKFNDAMKEIQEDAQKADDRLNEEIENHPDNGKTGWWYISGIRHEAHVKASSAREAIDKAIKSDKIGDWEICCVPTFVGEKTPEVF